MDSLTRPAMLLVGGRAVGLAASFAIGIVLARLFEPAAFGTYKQFFLVFGTLYGLVQLGMAESLYYFVPRRIEDTGRYVCNAMLVLAGAGLACLALLAAARDRIAAAMSNPALAEHALLLGIVLVGMLVSAVLEIVMIARGRHAIAAATYAASDVARTVLFIAPALIVGTVSSVLAGAALFAAIRLVATVVGLWRTFGRRLRPDVPLLRLQLAYALPFALAVGVEVVYLNYHQWVVASAFDAATFAIYAIGCLQIPLVDLVVTSTANVLMVKMGAESSRGRAALALWHATMERLAFLLIPLTVFLLLEARHLIVGVFTETYAASVPIFTIWALAILPNVLAVDAVLRVYAQTRFLLAMNVSRLAIVAASIGWALSTFGLAGAVLVTLAATAALKLAGAVRITRLIGVRPWEALPWRGLAAIAATAAAAAIPLVWLHQSLELAPLPALLAGAAVYGSTYGLLAFASPLAARVGLARRSGRARPAEAIGLPARASRLTGPSSPAD